LIFITTPGDIDNRMSSSPMRASTEYGLYGSLQTRNSDHKPDSTVNVDTERRSNDPWWRADSIWLSEIKSFDLISKTLAFTEYCPLVAMLVTMRVAECDQFRSGGDVGGIKQPESSVTQRGTVNN